MSVSQSLTTARRSREKVSFLVLLLYLATLSVDAGRKVIGLPVSTLGIVYILVGAIYLFSLRRMSDESRAVPDALPVCLVLLSLWCISESIIPGVPFGMAILGWSSYAFFVPLLYVGAALMSDDRRARRTLQVAAIGGAVVGLGAVASALLRQAAPALLQPIVASVGVHSFDAENIYLAPSFFATAEEAAEVLLISLFGWIALASLPNGKLARTSSAVIGVLLAGGLIAAERRADIVVAVAGVLVLLLPRPIGTLGTTYRPASLTTALARGRLGSAVILAIAGAITLVSFLGASKLVPFLTSVSNGQGALRLMFSPAHPGALSGQGTGTSTQGASLVGAITFVGIDRTGPYAGYVVAGRTFVVAEGGLTKTWLELGIVGVILYGGVFLSALGPAIGRWRRTDGTGRALTVLTLALGIVFLKGHQSLDDPLIQPCFWLAAGGALGRIGRPSPWPEDAASSSPAILRNNGVRQSASRSSVG